MILDGSGRVRVRRSGRPVLDDVVGTGRLQAYMATIRRNGNQEDNIGTVCRVGRILKIINRVRAS